MPLLIYLRRSNLLVVATLMVILAACQTPGSPTNQAPSAAFVATPSSGAAPLRVAFDGRASSDADGVVVDHFWTFGDGTTDGGVTTVHTYSAPGTYVARLLVSDDDGATATAQRTITVVGGATGRLVGTLSVGAGGAGGTATLDPPANLVPGEIIVRFRTDVVATLGVAASLSVDGIRLDAVRDLAIAGARLYRTPGLDRVATVALARRLAARPDVAYAQPNYVLQPLQTVPTDPDYDRQWHYPAIHLPVAWDVTTGSSDIVVAVVDTGILHAAGNPSRTHPDLIGRVLPGYDFVSNPAAAGDGGGRDSDPYDVDDRADGSRYHGTHVAGTIGAATNDGYGVAGVDWNAGLLPIRALGIGGGTLADIVDGTLWAAGFAVVGVPANTNPAHVINLSLGGSLPCGPLEQEAFDLIATSSVRNAVVVVAAGNEDVDARDSTPAGCRNVITVGATDALGARAPYSNFGSRIDVMAPGGDLTANRNGDGELDGILSLVKLTNGAFGHALYQGTSMAAPHVAGVVSLMKALDPDLTASDARGLLVLTADPLTVDECGTGTAGDCGAGLINAGEVIDTLAAGIVPTPDGGELAFSPNPVELGSEASEASVMLTNTGDATASWTYEGLVSSAGDPSPLDFDDVSVEPLSGSLGVGASESLNLSLDRGTGLANGAYQLTLLFDVDGVEQGLTVRFRVGTPDDPTATGPTIVGAFIEVGGELILGGNQQAATYFATFDFTVLAGDQLIVAWTDQNDNLELDEGDFLGTYPTWVTVAAGATVTGVDVVLESVIEVDPAVAVAAANGDVTSAVLRAAVEQLAANGGPASEEGGEERAPAQGR